MLSDQPLGEGPSSSVLEAELICWIRQNIALQHTAMLNHADEALVSVYLQSRPLILTAKLQSPSLARPDNPSCAQWRNTRRRCTDVGFMLSTNQQRCDGICMVTGQTGSRLLYQAPALAISPLFNAPCCKAITAMQSA